MEVALPLRFTLVEVRSSSVAPCDPSMAGWYRAERWGSELTKSKPLLASCDPELACMCLAARTQFGPAEALQVASLVRDGLNFPVFLAQLERHYVAPLVLRSLNSIGGAGIPSRVLETMRVRSRITAWKSELFAAELVRLFELFERRSIQVINYKGAVAAGQFYGAVALRNFNDLDFLVRRADLSAIVALLEEEGYANSSQFTADQFEHVVAEFKEFVFRRGEFSLEPHWSLTGKRYPFETDYEGFWQRAGVWNFNGVALRVFAPEDALLVHCLVGAKGRWQRLQMVCDVAECVRACPDMDWARVNEMSRATGTVRILHVGLLLAAELSGAQLPDDVAVAVRKSPQVRSLARTVLSSWKVRATQRRFLPDSPSIFSPMLFRQRERFRDRWRYLWRTTTTPSVLHMERLPLPKWLYPAYRVAVPFHDYVLVPLRRLVFQSNVSPPKP